MIRTKKRMALCAVLLIVMLSFIWGNSLRSGTDSGAMSGSVMAWINTFLHLSESGADTLHLVIRKIAHFTEFACLGALFAWLFGMLLTKRLPGRVLPLLCAFTAAGIDETIQCFIPDRGPSLWDVGLDTCGAAVGIVLLSVGYHIRKKNNTFLEETK